MDLTKVPPIEQKRIVEFVNNFVISTVSFLNKFANNCEIHLQSIDVKIKRVEAELSILEAKLNSVEDLKDISQYEDTQVESNLTPVTPTPNVQTESNVNKENVDSQNNSSISSTNNNDEENIEKTNESIDQQTTDSNIEKTENEEENVKKPKEIPEEIKRFYKMVQFGVPKQAVKLKMKSEGFDPDLLDS